MRYQIGIFTHMLLKAVISEIRVQLDREGIKAGFFCAVRGCGAMQGSIGCFLSVASFIRSSTTSRLNPINIPTNKKTSYLTKWDCARFMHVLESVPDKVFD